MLSDGATTFANASGRRIAKGRADNAPHINAVMVVKAAILDSNDGGTQRFWYLVRRELLSLQYTSRGE